MWVLYGFVIVAGMLNALQSGANGTLGKTLQQPFLAALMIVSISATSLLIAGSVSGHLAWPESGKWSELPWWAWVGGICGATFVMSQLLVAHEIGAGPYIALTVTAAVVVSLVLDHFGWMGFSPHPANLWRLAGAALMITGVSLISRF